MYLDQSFKLAGLPDETKIGPVLADEYTIVWIGHATGNAQIDFKAIKVHNQNWFFLTPGQLFSLKTFQTVGTIITFSEHFALKNGFERGYFRTHPLFHNTSQIPLISPEGMERTNMDIVIKLIAQESKRKDSTSQIIQSYLGALLELSARAFRNAQLAENPKYNQIDERAHELNRLIEEYFSSYHDTRYYASQLELTPKRANEIFKDVYQKTITEAIHSRLILEMKRRIGYSAIPINQIALELGYKDPSYMSRFFKKNENCSPHEFRDECSNSE